MSDFYSRLNEYKALKRLSNKELGAAIGLTQDAFRMAVNNKRLTDLQKKEFERFFALPKTEGDNTNSDSEEDQAVNYILDHPELRDSNPRFKVYCDLLVAEAKLEYMEKYSNR